ncbi:MAG: D-alanine--D-alanine ligase [Chloroflexi bacterium]|nr:D-alanine--D-alanine ligase [Chloroflexota bacterium]
MTNEQSPNHPISQALEKRIRVGIIFGGKSGEHEISLASAQGVARAIDRDKYDVVLIGVTKEGRWITGGNALQQLAAISPTPLLAPESESTNGAMSAPIASAELMPTATATSPLATIDVAFPLVHGPFGEDGTMQGLLELADIPYVGAGVAASAVGMDKALMKAVFRAHNLPILDWLVILRRDWNAQPDDTIYRIESVLGYPCFIKPANLGSSVGVAKAHQRDELKRALDRAAQYDRKLIAERAAQNAREIECSVLGNDEPIASIPGEVIPRREFYDYAAKYESDSGTELIVPADLAPELARSVQEIAARAFKAIDACGMARVDFFLERGTQKLLLNEINTIPGFTSVSMYPRMWQQSGVSYADLIDRLIRLALERHADKRRSKIAYEA